MACPSNPCELCVLRPRVVIPLILAWFLVVGRVVYGAEPDPKPPEANRKTDDTVSEDAKKAEKVPVKLGLITNDPRAFQGYTLLAPMDSKKTYLVDMEGKVTRTWESDATPALVAYLLGNGNLLRSATSGPAGPGFGGIPGAGGRVQEFDWDGQVVWDYKFTREKMLPHHDLIKLPNGNVMLVVSERKNRDEAIAAGRAPETLGDDDLKVDCLIEVKPTGKDSGEIVWEWRIWDHLVQDRDSSKANYADVAAHPELIDVNFGEGIGALLANKGEADKLKSIGYVGGNTGGSPRGKNGDWTHVNSVSYIPDRDQVIVTSFGLSEFWIIDHTASTAEAASHAGGRSGKGGDLLYRWGNPATYRAGTAQEQVLFHPHNAHLIAAGYPGEGHVLLFNNAHPSADGNFSSVDEITLPLEPNGTYSRPDGAAFGPREAIWSYTAPKKSDLNSGTISGAQRLANGDTLICSGQNGTIFEVTPEKETVWKYVNPIKGKDRNRDFNPFAELGQLLPSFVRDQLKLSDDQRKELDTIQNETRQRIDKLFTDEQRKQFAELQAGGKPGDRQPNLGPPAAGRPNFGPAAAAGNLTGKGGPGDGRPRGPGGGGPPGGSAVFRAYRFASSFSGLAGRDLKAEKSLQEIAELEAKEQEAAKKPDGSKDSK